ncbi:hypothetical protein [Butyrivibrio sp. FC2001]|uniref:hypothetical protein n=1 Tax=Butyrivibrio sp. FC2001 TaxID=1280671 RepID=UPI001A986EB9|nr:hypothetical protein [Butyrivibrio sp. FC2001]
MINYFGGIVEIWGNLDHLGLWPVFLCFSAVYVAAGGVDCSSAGCMWRLVVWIVSLRGVCGSWWCGLFLCGVYVAAGGTSIRELVIILDEFLFVLWF